MGLKKKGLFRKAKAIDIPAVITNGMPISSIYDDGLAKFQNCYSYIYDLDDECDLNSIVSVIEHSNENVSIKLNKYNIPIKGREESTFLILTAYASTPEKARACIRNVAVKLRQYDMAYNNYFVTDRLRSLFDFFNFSTKRKFLEGFLTKDEWSSFRHSNFEEEYGQPLKILIGPDDLEFDREIFRLNNKYGQVLYLQNVADILSVNKLDAVKSVTEEYAVSAEIDKDKDGKPCLSVIIAHYADSIEELQANSSEIRNNFKRERVHVAPMPYKRQKEGLNALAPTGTPRLMLGKIIKNN